VCFVFRVQSSDSGTSCLSVLIDVQTSGIRIQTPDQVSSETSEGVHTWDQVSS